MPDEIDANDDKAPSLPMSDLEKGGGPENANAAIQSELEEVLARMTDPEVRVHFEELLRALGHQP